jgi:hypothetical protein
VTLDDSELGAWNQRRLCPDGGCIGVLGADGACGVCGRVDAAAASRPAELEAHDDAAAAPAPRIPEGADGGDDARAAAARDGEDDDWQRRELCPDGACTGVLRDGRCGTCGRSAS